MTMETRTATDAAASVPAMIEHAIKGGSTVITKNGKRKAAMVPVEDFDHYQFLTRSTREGAGQGGGS